MRLIRILGVVVAVLALVAFIPSAPAAEKSKGKKGHAIKGVVAAVDRDKDGDKDKDTGTITLTIPAHKDKKTGEETKAEEKKVKVTEATKFVKVSGKKGERKEETATYADVKDGEHVVVRVEGGVAVEVAIHHHKKKAA
jgi:hypothetical protein